MKKNLTNTCGQGNVRSGKCPFGEMSLWGNVLVGKCPVWEVSFGELSVRGNVHRGLFRRGNVSRGIVLGEVSVGELFSQGTVRIPLQVRTGRESGCEAAVHAFSMV